MIQRCLISILSSIIFFVGCTSIRDGGHEPIVAPTEITNEVQDVDEPVLQPYKPWWVKE